MGEPVGEAQSTWTRAQVEAFLAREKPRYQKIALPYGLSTEGEDRSETSRTILPERLDGKSVLDVGCFLGHFSHECLRRGATRVTAVDVNTDRLRQARAIADMLGLEVDFVRADVERGLPAGTFDLVLCLNVIQHLKDPIAGIDHLVRATGERLLLEVAGLENHTARKLLFGRGLVGRLPRPMIRQRPLAVIGTGRKSRYDELFFFTPLAIEHLVLGHKRTLARVECRPSAFRGRFLVEAWKRRIGEMRVVCGLPGSGKTTVCERLQQGALPELEQTLAPSGPQPWVLTSPFLLDDLTEPVVPRLLFHYDLLRGSALMNCAFERDSALELLDCADDVRAALVWAEPKLCAERLARRWAGQAGGEATERSERERAERLEFLRNPERIAPLLAEWFAWCRGRGLALEFVDNTGEPARIDEAEFRRRARAAGLALD